MEAASRPVFEPLTDLPLEAPIDGPLSGVAARHSAASAGRGATADSSAEGLRRTAEGPPPALLSSDELDRALAADAPASSSGGSMWTAPISTPGSAATHTSPGDPGELLPLGDLLPPGAQLTEELVVLDPPASQQVSPPASLALAAPTVQAAVPERQSSRPDRTDERSAAPARAPKRAPTAPSTSARDALAEKLAQRAPVRGSIPATTSTAPPGVTRAAVQHSAPQSAAPAVAAAPAAITLPAPTTTSTVTASFAPTTAPANPTPATANSGTAVAGNATLTTVNELTLLETPAPDMTAPVSSTSALATPTPAATTTASAPAAVAPSTSVAPVAAASAQSAVTPPMDRDFIARNQIVERYLSGRLPLKGATDFERFCHDNPQLLDEIGLPERVNAGLRLLEASGKPEPWQEPRPPFWRNPYLVSTLAAATVALAVALAVVANSSAAKTVRITKLQKEAFERPLDAATSTREIRLLPSREGASNTPAITLGGGSAQLADFRIDESRSPYKSYRITIDRIDQGRVAVIRELGKDSNGHLRLALNTSALGPGNYQLTIEGLNWRGEPEPDSWVTIGIQR